SKGAECRTTATPSRGAAPGVPLRHGAEPTGDRGADLSAYGSPAACRETGPAGTPSVPARPRRRGRASRRPRAPPGRSSPRGGVTLVVTITTDSWSRARMRDAAGPRARLRTRWARYSIRSPRDSRRSEEHTSELQSRENLVCRLL